MNNAEETIRRLHEAEGQRDALRAEVERLKDEAAEARFEHLLAKKYVAEKQREACAKAADAWDVDPRAPLDIGATIRATPLVTG